MTDEQCQCLIDVLRDLVNAVHESAEKICDELTRIPYMSTNEKQRELDRAL